MHRTETKRFLAIMEFCYGFLFGVALFGATLTFLITPDFFPAVLFAVCIFAFFIFLTAIVRYCIIRIKIASEMLGITIEMRDSQEQYLQERMYQIAHQHTAYTQDAEK